MSVPVYAADPADHAHALDRFLARHSEWTRHRRWPGEATYALHESLVLRAELHHAPDPGPRDEIWTIAAYHSPVGDRLWHATATAGTPKGIITTLLESLVDDNGWANTTWAKSTTAPDRKPTLPLTDYSWKETATDTGAAWTSPDGGCRLQRDQNGTWEATGGREPRHHSWAVRFTQHTPPEIIQQVVFELAEGQGQLGTPRTPHPPSSCPAPAAGPPVSNVRSPTSRGR